MAYAQIIYRTWAQAQNSDFVPAIGQTVQIADPGQPQHGRQYLGTGSDTIAGLIVADIYLAPGGGGGGGQASSGIGYTFTEDGGDPASGELTPIYAVTVSGAGTSAANGTYVYAGLYNGKPWYALVGGTNTGNPGTSDAIFYDALSIAGYDWYVLTSAGGTTYYAANADSANPYAASWITADGSDPAPTVTKDTTASLIGGMFVNQTDTNGNDMGSVLATFSAGGLLYVNVTSDDTAYSVFKITACTDSGSYYTLTGSYLSGVLPNDGGAVRVTIAPVEVTGVKRYVALLTQSGTNAPVATVLENSLGGAVVWSYEGVTIYKATLAGAFPLAKTVILCGSVSDSGNPYFVYGEAATYEPDGINLTIPNAPGDGLLLNTPITITVYP